MPEPIIRAKQLAYVRVEATDRAKAEKFLKEFGLQIVERTKDRTYLRGTDAQAPCYILSQGSGSVTTIAFEADSLEDLRKLAALPYVSDIEALDEPSGGQVVRLTDPLGMTVEIVHGRQSLAAIDAAPSHAFNMDGRRERVGELPAVSYGPSHVRRLGHLVLESADPPLLYRWYHEHFGLTKSDAVVLPEGPPQMIFSRLDRGEDYVDHHVVGFQFALDEGTRVQHVAFEVGNLDDLMAGHEYLKRRKYKNVWGIGRHLLGGQIFDYWKSPFGLIHEHWTDTDLLNDQHQAGDCAIGKMRDYWGPEPTPAFLVSRWNFKVIKNLVRILKARSRTSA